MRQKISTEDLRVGMFVHGFEGRWIDHPFWKTRFTVEDAPMLQAIRASGVREVWVEQVDPTSAAAPSPAPADAARPLAVAPSEPPVERLTLADEAQQAAALLRRAREVVGGMFHDARLGRALDVDRCQPIVEGMLASIDRHRSALLSIARLKIHDDYTYAHSMTVGALMMALTRALGMGDEAALQAGMAGMVHDLGKSGIPLEVLNKPGALTDAEFELMRGHPRRGHQILIASGMKAEVPLDVCLHHHERLDGMGYPDRLSGDEVTIHARIAAVCDVYDALSSNRVYKPAWDPGHALAKMASWRGQFDPSVLAAFVSCLGIYPVGTLVRLASGRIGVVVDQTAGHPASPVVRAFYSTRSSLPIPPLQIDLSQPGCSDRIVGKELRRDWPGIDIDGMWLPERARAALAPSAG